MLAISIECLCVHTTAHISKCLPRPLWTSMPIISILELRFSRSMMMLEGGNTKIKGIWSNVLSINWNLEMNIKPLLKISEVRLLWKFNVESLCQISGLTIFRICIGCSLWLILTSVYMDCWHPSHTKVSNLWKCLCPFMNICWRNSEERLWIFLETLYKTIAQNVKQRKLFWKNWNQLRKV